MVLAVAPETEARAAGLRHVDDAMPGIRRLRSGPGFRYVDERGRPVRDRDVITRIRAMAIPPAWDDVWICPSDRGHLQATGRDAKGRKQYRYHPEWRRARDRTKFDRLRAFGRALPRIRRRVDRDLARPGLSREKVLAAVVRILDRAFLRIGNEAYVQENQSFGLTTLRAHHATVQGSTVRLRFRGKSGKAHDVALEDARLARVVRRCRDLPGYLLFQYADGDDSVQRIESGDVNEYLLSITGEPFTAKDFRTWAGTLAFAQAAVSDPEARAPKLLGAVAACLGNTPAVCRSAYVHPALIRAHEDGALAGLWDRVPAAAQNGLRRDESRLIRVLGRIERAGRKAA